MGHVFPEIREKRAHVSDVIRLEEEAFNRTLDEGLKVFQEVVDWKRETQETFRVNQSWMDDLGRQLESGTPDAPELARILFPRLAELAAFRKALYQPLGRSLKSRLHIASGDGEEDGNLVLDDILPFATSVLSLLSQFERDLSKFVKETVDAQRFDRRLTQLRRTWNRLRRILQDNAVEGWRIGGAEAFLLYDTYGFPLDLTEVMARENRMSVDTVVFEKLMEEQRERARKAQKKEVISLSQVETSTPTRFVGYEELSEEALVLQVVTLKDKVAVILSSSPCYAEMGGQVGDTGEIVSGSQLWHVVNTQKVGNTWLHFVAEKDAPVVGAKVTVRVDTARRAAIQRHHTVTHLLHWALHEVVSRDAMQRGSSVGPDKLTFDFNSAALTPAQVADVEQLVNERILENAGVCWQEVPYAEVKSRKEVTQMFGEKYGDTVRVVQVGGKAGAFNGYSMELCGGTHTRATGEIGLFRILGESAIAAGIRRIEAAAGLAAYDQANSEKALIANLATRVNSPIGELDKKVESLLLQQKDLEKQLKALQQKQAAELGRSLIAKAQRCGNVETVIENLGPGDGDFLQNVADSLKGQFKGVVVLMGVANGAVSIVATVSAELTSKIQAGKLLQAIAPIVGGKGGGRPDNARGGGKDASKIDEALAKARALAAAI